MKFKKGNIPWMKGRIPWNKGLTKYTSEKVRIGGEHSFISNKGKKRKPISEEHKRKISEGNKGRKISEEHRERLRIINTGKKRSDETKNKNRISHLGNTWIKLSGEEIAKKRKEEYSKRFINKNPMKLRGGWSIEERKKLSDKFKGRKAWNKGLKGMPKNINMDGLKKGHGWNKGIDNRIKIVCSICGKEKKIKQSHYLNNKNKIFFCSRQCKGKYFSADKCHLWNNGKSFELYDKYFNITLKNSIRKRDNQVCMLCGIHREKLNQALSIHHINYDKQLSIKENCISLCQNCHIMTNLNREHWTRLFQSLLHKIYGYNYSENLEPILTI